MPKIYRILVFLILITATVGLYLISHECNKLHNEIKELRVTVADAANTASSVSKQIIEEIEIVREKGTRLKFLIF